MVNGINVDEFLKDTRPSLDSIVKNNNSEIGRVVSHDPINRRTLTVHYFGLDIKKEELGKDLLLIKGKLNCDNEECVNNLEREYNTIMKVYKGLPNTILELNKEIQKKYD